MKILIKIDGTTPLIHNKFHDAAAMEASEGTRTAIAGADRGTPQEVCESKIYRDLDNDPCIPQPNLLRCIVDGGKFHKSGKSQITTQKSSLLYAAVDIEGVTIKISHRQPWKVDTRPVRIPATGGRILRHRPIFDDWSLSFTMTVDVSIVSTKLMRLIVDDAGKRIGLGDFRPSCKGPYGRFCVVKWVEMADDADESAPLQIAAE